jgi:hypothetical protein
MIELKVGPEDKDDKKWQATSLKYKEELALIVKEILQAHANGSLECEILQVDDVKAGKRKSD